MLETTKDSLKGIGLQFFAEGAEGDAGQQSEQTQQQDSQTKQTQQEDSQQNQQDSKQYTQEDINRMMAREKRTARQALLKELGYDPKDEKSFNDTLAEIKKNLDAGKSQQQLDTEARKLAETKLADEQAKTARLELKVAALAAGVKAEALDDVITLALSKIDDSNTIDKVLKEFKTKYPAFFGESTEGKGTGSPTNPPRKGGNTQDGMGKRLAQTNKSTAKSSYFKN